MHLLADLPYYTGGKVNRNGTVEKRKGGGETVDIFLKKRKR